MIEWKPDCFGKVSEMDDTFCTNCGYLARCEEQRVDVKNMMKQLYSMTQQRFETVRKEMIDE